MGHLSRLYHGEKNVLVVIISLSLYPPIQQKQGTRCQKFVTWTPVLWYGTTVEGSSQGNNIMNGRYLFVWIK